MRDTSFLGFGYQPPTPEPLPVVAQVRKRSATDQVRGWLRAHPGFHTVVEISEATGVSVNLVNKAISNLYQRGGVKRETERKGRGIKGQPQRYAWVTR